MSSTEAQFLASEDLSKYKGKWVAILDNKVIASGDSISEVYEKTRSSTRTPLFERIPSEGEIERFIL